MVSEKTNVEMGKILRSWPVQFDNKLAYKLGFKAYGSFEQAASDYKGSLSS